MIAQLEFAVMDRRPVENNRINPCFMKFLVYEFPVKIKLQMKAFESLQVNRIPWSLIHYRDMEMYKCIRLSVCMNRYQYYARSFDSG